MSTQLENFYELNNALYLFNIDLTNLDSSDLVSITYQPLSPYPFVKFDLSFMVDTNFQGEKIINEVEKIESWKGDAYQTGDDIELALEEIKRLIGYQNK